MTTEAQKRWKLRNPEKVKASKRRWARGYGERNWISRCMYHQIMTLAFPAEATAIRRREYLKNKDKYRESSRAWKQANRDRVNFLGRQEDASRKLERQRRWRKNHPDKARELKARRRFRLSETCPAIVAIYKRAVELSQWFDVEVDHIIPLARGGQHVPENLQIIYGYENKRKHANPNYKPHVIFT